MIPALLCLVVRKLLPVSGRFAAVNWLECGAMNVYHDNVMHMWGCLPLQVHTILHMIST